MSEKKPGPSGRTFRPDGPAVPPSQDVIDELLNEEVHGDGMHRLPSACNTTIPAYDC